MEIGTMGVFTINDEMKRPARVTYINDDEKLDPARRGTVDLLVMTHFDDYPEFSTEECTNGHAHKEFVEIGTGNDQFQPDAEQEVFVSEELAGQLLALNARVTDLEDKIAKLSAPTPS